MSNRTLTTEAIETAGAAAADYATKNLEQTFVSLKDGMARASTGIEQTQAKLKEAAATAMKKAEEIVRFNQASIEALTQSSQIWVAGVQDLSKQVAASYQASVQQTIGAFEALRTVKTLKQAIDLQSGFARAALEKTIGDSGRLTQASVTLTQQALAPLTNRVNAVVETFGKIA